VAVVPLTLMEVFAIASVTWDQPPEGVAHIYVCPLSIRNQRQAKTYGRGLNMATWIVHLRIAENLLGMISGWMLLNLLSGILLQILAFPMRSGRRSLRQARSPI